MLWILTKKNKKIKIKKRRFKDVDEKFFVLTLEKPKW